MSKDRMPPPPAIPTPVSVGASRVPVGDYWAAEVVDNEVLRESLKSLLHIHGFDPNNTYRVVVRAGSITVHQYALNDDGHPYIDETDGFPALRAPVTVPLIASFDSRW